MCRNHRGFIDAVVAARKLGANALFLNTAFAGPQLADVPSARSRRRSSTTRSSPSCSARRRAAASASSPGTTATRRPSDPTLEELIAARRPGRPRPAGRAGQGVILTSGTTGTPKGACRAPAESLDPAAALLSTASR